MTITKQASTLFGGWAEVQTLPSIGIGVSKPSDTALLSISKKKWTLSIDLYLRDSERSLSTRYRSDGYYNEFDWDVESEDFARWDEKQAEKIKDFLQRNFQRTAFVRYVEAWITGLNPEGFQRGVLGTQKMVNSFSGMMGACNNHALGKSGSKWIIVDETKLYPKIRRMPPEGIKRIRVLARERIQKN